jgi:hypothetical protein
MVRSLFSSAIMETFSLLQTSLDQTIDRQSIEQASSVARSIVRADCARMQRELFGILVSRLERAEVLAFQIALARFGFPTEVVADSELPVLQESFQIQRIEQRGELLVLTDSMGRERARPLPDLVFLSAGFFNRIEFKTVWHQHLDFGRGVHHGKGMPQMVIDREFREETELHFRIDFFFQSEPHRLHAILGPETAIFHQGKPLRLKDRTGLEELMTAMASLLPPDRLNSWLYEPNNGRVYPNLQCYEEEIRWHFHQLKPHGQ